MIHIHQDRFLIDEKPGLVLGGEYQYFRIPHTLWASGIQSLKEAGVNVISSYIPWIWHEPQEGKFDFTGKTDPGRNLVGFLELCEKARMPLLLKPGPYIYAEYQGFGIPSWVAKRYPDLRMSVGISGYREISVNHPGFLLLVKNWFGALWPHLRKLHNLVALQLDNETGLPQYMQGPFLYDKNPDTLRQMKEAFKAKYGEIAAMNSAWGTHYKDFDAWEFPKHPNMEVLRDCAGFAEDYLVGYLQNLKEMWREMGYQGALYTNDVSILSWPNNWRKKSAVATVAYDIYPKFIRVSTVLDQPFSISFVPKVFENLDQGPLFCAEMGCGWLDQGVRVPAIATVQKVMASYLHGAKGAFFYPIQDGTDPGHRSYIFKAAFDRHGNPSERMAVVKAIGSFCREWGEEFAQSTAIQSPVGIAIYPEGIHDVVPYAMNILNTASHQLDEAIDRMVILHAGGPGLWGVLSEAGYAPRVFDLNQATEEDLTGCRMVFFNSTGPLPQEIQAKLQRYVENGGHLVTLGIPFDNPHLLPAKLHYRWHPQSLASLWGTAKDLLEFKLLERNKIPHPLVRFTIDKLQPVMGVIKHATRSGVWMSNQLTGEPVWTSRFAYDLELPPGAHSLLKFAQRPTSYWTHLGKGTSIFMGTLLGAHCNSPGYYLDDPQKRRSLVEFMTHLLTNWQIYPLHAPIPGVEVIQRETKEKLFVGFINRGEEREFSLPIKASGLRRCFSYLGSKANWDGVLGGNLKKGDVLVVELMKP